MTPTEVAEDIARRLHALEGPTGLLGIMLEKAGEGLAVGSMRVTRPMLNGLGTVHGGMLFLLADTVFAWACNSRGVDTVAQQASISFLRPAVEGDTLVAEARELALAGRTGSYEVVVRGNDGEVVAIFTGLSRALGRAPRDAPG